MLIRKAYKYQLKTTRDQNNALKTFSDCNRFVWNKSLALQSQRLDRHEKKDRKLLTYNELACFLTLWKQSSEWYFLKEAPSQTLQQTLKDLERAIKDAFDRRQPLKKFPVFKRKDETKGFRFPQGMIVRCNQVFLPKIGWVTFRNSRKLEGAIKNITISERCGKWYVSIQVEVEVKPEEHANSKKYIGIDLGITHTVSLSNGDVLQGAKSYRKYKLQLAKEQRKLAKKQKFSSNWKKQKSRITKLHKKISDVRQDRNHWISTKLVRDFGQIYSEDLKIKNMTKNSKGTLESPGKMVKQKSGLNREILDQAWYEFCRQLEYKSNWSSGQYGQIDPKYTSQRCSVKYCGHKAKENRENQAKFLCKKCGHEENADINAAKNILAAGLAVFACGGKSSDSSKKQEPLAA